VPDERLQEILASVPELQRHSQGFRLFTQPEIDHALSRGGESRETVPFELVEGAVEWAPTAGELLWVVAGRGPHGSLVAALYLLPDGGFRHAASFILEDERVPIALAYGRGQRRELFFSACWSCLGEDGTVQFREDDTVVIVQ